MVRLFTWVFVPFTETGAILFRREPATVMVKTRTKFAAGRESYIIYNPEETV